jgi:hypothetical protein
MKVDWNSNTLYRKQIPHVEKYVLTFPGQNDHIKVTTRRFIMSYECKTPSSIELGVKLF